MKKLNYLQALGRGTADEGEKLFLTDINGEKINDGKNDIWVKVIGRMSDRFKKEVFKIGKKNAKRNKNYTPSLSEAEESAAELLAVCITDWNFSDDGKVIELTADNKKEMLLTYPFMKEQIDTFIADDTNFMKSADKA